MIASPRWLSPVERVEITIYQAILFDLDDTLFSLRGCEAQALQRTLDGVGLMSALPADFTDRYAAISSGYWAARSSDGTAQYTRNEILELSWRDFLSQQDLEAGRSTELAGMYWTKFCRSSALNPGAEEVLRRLSESYRLGMITNGYSDSQRGRLQAAGLLDVFNPLLVSEEAGVEKPDARIFEMALTKLGLPSEAVLYVGDSISHDREGCRRAGIDFCHYCPDRQGSNLPSVKYRIGHLRELIPLLLSDA
ncbi:MAG: HAD-IA family hydrolase [Chloroflexi bacterium]|nr:HAD-IA family hydrolase [Chloroflexota bacterium]